MLDNISIRLAYVDDIPSIVDIYNQGIRKRQNAILDEIEIDKFTNDFANRDLIEYPIYLAIRNDNVVGWISISPYRSNRRAYRMLKEVSFYIDNQFVGQGIGSQLLQFIIDSKHDINFDSLLAILLANNQHSILLLKKFGFSLWGYMPKVLNMDNKKEDAIIYGRNFN